MPTFTRSDLKSTNPQEVDVHTSFTPLTGSGDAGVTNVSGSRAWASIRHHSASDAVPYPGVYRLELEDNWMRLVSCHVSLQTSGTVEGTGSNGLFLPRSFLQLKTTIPPSFPKDTKAIYVTIIQPYTSGSNQGAAVKDHAHIGMPGPRDLSGSVEDKINVRLVLSNTRDL